MARSPKKRLSRRTTPYSDFRLSLRWDREGLRVWLARRTSGGRSSVGLDWLWGVLKRLLCWLFPGWFAPP